MQLFKYLPLSRLDVIDNLKIRFSPLSSLNDPYEIYHSIDISQEINEVIKEGIDECESLWNSLTQTEQFEQKKDYLKTIKSIKKNGSSIIESSSMSTELSQMLDTNIGILSLSRTNTQLLMWSHYAESGRGFIIGFDSEHDFFHKKALDHSDTNPIVMKYSNYREKIKINSIDCISKILGIKPIEWAYEQEERITINFLGQNLVKDSDNKPIIDPFGNNIFLTNIPKEAIKAIYIGTRMPLESKKHLFSSLKKNKINCKVYQAQVSKKQYKIEYFEINDCY